MPAHSLGGSSAWALTTGTDQQVSGKKEFLNDTVLSDTTIEGKSVFSGPIEFSPENLFPMQYEPAGANLITNPSFETGTAGWELFNGATNFTTPTGSVPVFGVYGTKYASVTLPDTVNNAGSRLVGPGVPVSSGETITFSVFSRVDNATNGTIRLTIDWNGSSGATLASTFRNVSVPNSGAPVRVSVTGVVPNGATHAQAYVHNSPDATAKGVGAVLLWDAAQLEKNSVATTYIDGSMGTGFAWTGTPHASTSTREANVIAVQAKDVATTNLVTNPSFEDNINGYAVIGSDTALSREPGRGVFGNFALRINAANTAGGKGVDISNGNARGISISASTTYTLSVWAWCPTGPITVALRMVWSDGAGTFISESASSARTIDITPQRYSFTATSPAAAASVLAGIYRTVQGGVTYYVDGFQYEAGNGSSYADGSLGTGYAWTGTPHASTSTRAANTIIPAGVKTPPPYGLVGDFAGRNMISNPRFEIDTAGWRPNHTDTVMTRETINSPVGATCARISVRGGTGPAYDGITGLDIPRIPAYPGQTTTLSVWVRGTPGKIVTLLNRAFNSSGNIDGQSSQSITLSDDWRRYSTAATAGVTATHWIPYLENNGTDQGAYTFYVSGYQLEEGNSATSYMDGSLGPGYEWEGTPHISPSRRTYGTHVVSSSPRFYVATEPWIAPNWLNGWSEYSDTYAVRFKKLASGLVIFKGLAKNTTAAAEMFILPPGYRPLNANTYHTCVSHNGSVYTTAYIVTYGTTGSVQFVGGDPRQPSFDSVSFLAER